MKIKFLPQNIEIEVKPGQSVLNAAQEGGVAIRSVCKGVPSCAECRVKVVEGINNVLPPMDAELDLIGTAHFVDNSRLACQMRCFGDLVVNLEDHVGKSMSTAKQPRGGMKKETVESSKARMGNVLEENSFSVVEIEMTDEEKKEAESLRVKSKDKKVDYSKGLKAGGKSGSSSNSTKKSKSNSKNRNNKNRKAASDASSSDNPSGGKKNRNRNRRRKPKSAGDVNRTSGGSKD